MMERREIEVTMQLRIKLMLDSAKGIHYLHSNGILHRDIKPHNILLKSFDLNDTINCKLADFGSSRNVNMLLTNLTFTDGIGTPKYMAPEILHSLKYKMPSDVYSFAITMLEICLWKNPFPESEFKYPWKIANFIAKGSRPSLINEVTIPEIKQSIESSWLQDPKERISIDTILSLLQSVHNTFS